MYLHPRPRPLTSFSNAGISSRFQGSRANFEILTISTAPIWPAMDVLFSFLSSLLSLFTAQRELIKLGTICHNFEQSVFWGYRVSQKFLEHVQVAPRKTIQWLTFWQGHLSSCQWTAKNWHSHISVHNSWTTVTWGCPIIAQAPAINLCMGSVWPKP